MWEQTANVVAFQAALKHVVINAQTMRSLEIFAASGAVALYGRTILSGYGICSLSAVDDDYVAD